MNKNQCLSTMREMHSDAVEYHLVGPGSYDCREFVNEVKKGNYAR